ncbi:MAG: cytochrome C, partial [Acidobacteria bacterium]|nr:cytochrome C [Acidobacteriota bacterium]
KPVTATVTPSGGLPVSGELVHIDDFTVAVRDASGAYHSWRRTRDLTIVRDDPYAAHIELLDRITDKQMHDVVAYLARVK